MKHACSYDHNMWHQLILNNFLTQVVSRNWDCGTEAKLQQTSGSGGH